MAEKKGRGRLSLMDLLPEEAQPIATWAAQELAAGSRHADHIYLEFRDKLIALQGELGIGFDIPSRSSFGRYSVRLARLTWRLNQTKLITEAFADRFDGKTIDDVNKAISMMLRMAAFQMLDSEETFGPKDLREMANGIRALAQADKMTSDQRRQFEDQLQAKTEEAMEKVAKVATEAGLSADRIAQLKRDFLGVRPKKPKRDDDSGDGGAAPASAAGSA